MTLKRFMRTGLWLAGIGLAASVVMLNVLAYSHAYTMTHFVAGGATTAKPEQLKPTSKVRALFHGIRVVRPSSDKAPADLDPRCEALTIRKGEDVALSAWYSGRGKEAPLAIIFHGYAEEKSLLMPEAKAFLEMGASALLVDFQGSGGSTGNDTTIGVREADDVAAAVRYANERLPHKGLVLFGRSMGAVAVLRAVREHAVAPDVVILEGVFDTLLNTVRNRFATMGVPAFPSAELMVFWGGVQHGYSAFAHRPVEYAKALKCPALFMHGSDDPRVKAREARRVFDAAPGSKVFKVFQGVGHESYVTRCPDEWRLEVAGFLKGGGDVQQR